MAPELPDALRLFDVSGRVALVTGASSGMGGGVARALAAAGATVALASRRLERMAPLAEEIGGRAFRCDLLDPEQVDGLVPEVADTLGGPEILVNIAGNVFEHDLAEDEQRADILKTMELNLLAPFRLAQCVFPHMKKAGRGSIVNVSSISGHVGVPSIPQAGYAASKIGLSGLTRELAVQWGRHSIRVNTIAAGFFRSEITDSLYDDEKGASYLRRNILLPIEGSADDFVGAILWLATDASRYVTGQTIFVDGGWTAK